MEVTQEQDHILFGTLLGDGHIQKRGPNSYRCRVTHSEKQEAYLRWKYEKLRSICGKNQPPVVKTDTKGYKTLEFYIASGKYLAKYHELFYKPDEKGNYIKRIDQNLVDNLPTSPVTLATWYMDDGGARDDSYAARLAVQSFSLAEIKLLVSYLEKCGISGAKPVTHLKSKEQYSLSLPATTNTFGQFVNKIQEIIINEVPSMRYKLNEERKPRND